MLILAIETSCDETAMALVEASGGLKNPQFKILKNLVASQIKIHQPYGGIVPHLAKREHARNLPLLFRKISRISNFQFPISKQISNHKSQAPKIDLIAVTVGPGLEPALWTGINFAKALRANLRLTANGRRHKNKTKIIGVNHLEGHLYSFLLPQKSQGSKINGRWSKIFPAVALIISGGHTILLLMKDLTHYKKLGETRDDAVGESFDKVARLLDLPYPGGPEIEKLALRRVQCGQNIIQFPRPMINQKNYDFSFSGLKTAVLYYLRDQQSKIKDSELKTNVADSFQRAAFDVLINKTLRAVKEFRAKSVLLSGGVASNNTLRTQFNSKLKTQNSKLIFLPSAKKFCLDNAAMIAVAGYINYLRNKKYQLIARGNLTLPR